MQDIMKLMQQQQNADSNPKRGAKAVRVLVPDLEEDQFTVGPALFGPDLGENEFQVGFYALMQKCAHETRNKTFPKK